MSGALVLHCKQPKCVNVCAYMYNTATLEYKPCLPDHNNSIYTVPSQLQCVTDSGVLTVLSVIRLGKWS